MTALAPTLALYFAAIMVVFAVFGLHRFWMAWRLLRDGGLGPAPEIAVPTHFPPLTIQLPMFNEGVVAERIIDAACRLDYPREQLEIQVLDDSIDGSTEIARRACERWASQGISIEFIHRTNREGFKAGALAAGLEVARGELVAIFDADFIPPTDLLHQMLPPFDDDGVGLVQARWTHLNRDESLLTRLQALWLDGHFVVEQVVRSRTGRWFNFNGTAGIWRREAIDDAGGWGADTLTEDTDLSYRAQLAGWRFCFLPHVTCPAELPTDLPALVSQQHRWTKGLVQTGVLLGPTLARASVPLKIRLEALLHLACPAPFLGLLMLAIIALAAPIVSPQALVALPSLGGTTAFAAGIVCLVLGTFGAATFSVTGQIAQGRGWRQAVWLTPALMALGIGLSVSNSRAIFGALLGSTSPFVRTPKRGSAPADPADASVPAPSARGRRRMPGGLVELALAVGLTGLAFHAGGGGTSAIGVPFLILFATGFGVVGAARVQHDLRPLRLRFRRPAVASPRP